MTRKHRLETNHDLIWNAIDGAIKDAVASHPDIIISDKRRSSLVKRIAGQILGLARQRGGQPPRSD